MPPPMKMTGKSPTPASTGPKVINSFNMNMNLPTSSSSSSSRTLASSISITPVNKGNSNGIGKDFFYFHSIPIFHFPAPVIRGVDAINGQSPTKHVEDESYEDLELELDEDDEGLNLGEIETVNDKNESHSEIPPEPSESHPIITSVTSLRRPSSESSLSPELSNQKAKKSFKFNQEKLSITVSPSPSQSAVSTSQVTAKRSLDSSEKTVPAPSKKVRLEGGNILAKTLTRPLLPTVEKPRPPPSSVEKPRPPPSLAPVVSKGLCYCEAEPLREASADTDYVCQAVENVGGHRVGCKNKVTRLEVVRLMGRDSTLLCSLGLLCELHRSRAECHGLCPLCGEFCSHGLVFMCRASKSSTPHLFHRHCYQGRPRDERLCPHCGSKRSPMAVQLKMTMSRTPLRLLNYTAKMTASKDKELLKVLDARTESRENVINYTLPSGKVISADGIPKGLEQNRLDEVIKNFNSKSNAKCTTRNMYLPTAAGDNVKLMQLLAMDYSPKQKFPEADGGTPLHVAAGNNHTLTTHILLQAGADIDAFDDNNETPLMIAAYNVRFFYTRHSPPSAYSRPLIINLHSQSCEL